MVHGGAEDHVGAGLVAAALAFEPCQNIAVQAEGDTGFVFFEFAGEDGVFEELFAQFGDV